MSYHVTYNKIEKVSAIVVWLPLFIKSKDGTDIVSKRKSPSRVEHTEMVQTLTTEITDKTGVRPQDICVTLVNWPFFYQDVIMQETRIAKELTETLVDTMTNGTCVSVRFTKTDESELKSKIGVWGKTPSMELAAFAVPIILKGAPDTLTRITTILDNKQEICGVDRVAPQVLNGYVSAPNNVKILAGALCSENTISKTLYFYMESLKLDTLIELAEQNETISFSENRLVVHNHTIHLGFQTLDMFANSHPEIATIELEQAYLDWYLEFISQNKGLRAKNIVPSVFLIPPHWELMPKQTVLEYLAKNIRVPDILEETTKLSDTDTSAFSSTTITQCVSPEGELICAMHTMFDTSDNILTQKNYYPLTAEGAAQLTAKIKESLNLKKVTQLFETKGIPVCKVTKTLQPALPEREPAKLGLIYH